MRRTSIRNTALLLLAILVVAFSAPVSREKIENAIHQAEDNTQNAGIENQVITVELPANSAKRKSKLGINRGISVASSEADAMKKLSESDDSTYFASFDATALSMAWVKLGSQERDMEESLTEKAKAKTKQELGYLPESFSAYVSADPALAPSEDDDEPPAALQRLFTMEEPSLTEDVRRVRQSEAQSYLATQGAWARLDPSNSMQHLHQPLPLVMWLTCDCYLDAHLARALAQAQRTFRKRHWERLLHLTYIPALAQQQFALDAMYQLDARLVPIGPCLERECPGNTKVITHRFAQPLAAPPSDLAVTLHNECCGDHFALALSAVTAEGFTLTVTRTDDARGWGQPLKARWSASGLPWTPAGGVPALLLDNIPQGVHTEKYRWAPPAAFWDLSPAAVSTTSRSVVAWLEGFLLGTLQPVVRSAPVPIVQAGPAPLAEVVADTFQEYVLGPRSDALLFLYSPFCPASRALSSLLSQVAGRLSEVTGLTIARFDKTKNDLPVVGIKVTHVPLLLFFPAGDYEDPEYQLIDYAEHARQHRPQMQSHFTAELLLKFLYEHTKATNWGALGEEIKSWTSAKLYGSSHGQMVQRVHGGMGMPMLDAIRARAMMMGARGAMPQGRVVMRLIGR